MVAAVFFWPDPAEPLEVRAAFPASIVAAKTDLPRPAAPGDDERDTALVLRSVDGVWRRIFERAGLEYEPADVRFFSGDEDDVCGDRPDDDFAGLYCPSERRIYFSRPAMESLDDLDWAYVVAHEVGHHVQELRDTLGDFEPYRVAHELQADCYSGVWAGATGTPEPSYSLYTVDDGTHGTPGQQQDWLRRGRSSRRPGLCASSG